jgi:uncharacterized protein (DUF486 family)
MRGSLHIVIGVVCAISGGVLWLKETSLINARVVASIAIILFGAFNILVGLNSYIKSQKHTLQAKSFTNNAKISEWIFTIGLIYIGSVSYTIAAYYHLVLKRWSFATAFAIALPLILIEYQFSIRGNRAANHLLKMNAVQITLLTMTFYFVNSWILNFFYLERKVVVWREFSAFACICLGFILTTTHRRV